MAEGPVAADAGADRPPRKDRMFVFAAAVPGLLVVLVGYVVGYAVAAWVCDLLGVDATRTPEAVGWTTGLVLLAAVVWFLVARWRRRQGGGCAREHQK